MSRLFVFILCILCITTTAQSQTSRPHRLFQKPVIKKSSTSTRITKSTVLNLQLSESQYIVPSISTKNIMFVQYGSIKDSTVIRIFEPAPAVTPWIDELFASYSSTTQLLNSPLYDANNTGTITLDTNTTFQAYDYTMRYDLPNRSSDLNRCTESYTGRNINFPSPQKEVWVEIWMKIQPNPQFQLPASWNCGEYYSSNWANNVQHSTGGGYQFFIGRVSEYAGGYGAVVGMDGNRVDVGYAPMDWEGPSSADGTHTKYIDETFRSEWGYTTLVWSGWVNAGNDPRAISSLIFDGKWHRYRFRMKASDYAGAVNSGDVGFWIDDTKIGYITGRDSGAQWITGLALGRMMRGGPPTDIKIWWGRVRVWNTNPGWPNQVPDA